MSEYELSLVAEAKKGKGKKKALERLHDALHKTLCEVIENELGDRSRAETILRAVFEKMKIHVKTITNPADFEQIAIRETISECQNYPRSDKPSDGSGSSQFAAIDNSANKKEEPKSEPEPAEAVERYPGAGGMNHGAYRESTPTPPRDSFVYTPPVQPQVQRLLQRPAQPPVQPQMQRPPQRPAQPPIQPQVQRPPQRPVQPSAQPQVQRPPQRPAQPSVQRGGQPSSDQFAKKFDPGAVRRPAPQSGLSKPPAQRPAQQSSSQFAQKFDPRALHRPAQSPAASQKPVNNAGTRVVGWLVCVNGFDRGKDFMLKNAVNTIGGAAESDIVLHREPAVTAQNHASIVFNAITSDCILQIGNGGSVRLNDRAVTQPAILKKFDTITIGSTKLVYAPFSEGLEWKRNFGL